jgi:uncharacterized protein YbdZ (MbtH family)
MSNSDARTLAETDWISFGIASANLLVCNSTSRLPSLRGAGVVGQAQQYAKARLNAIRRRQLSFALVCFDRDLFTLWRGQSGCFQMPQGHRCTNLLQGRNQCPIQPLFQNANASD